MNDVIRITNHPSQTQALLVYAGPTLAAFMGRITYARWSPDDHAYLLHADALDGLRRYADRDNVTVVDQRTPTSDGPNPQPQECRHCAQPGSWTRPPAYCPGCGHRWDPVPPPATVIDAHAARPTCPGCGRRQRAGFTHCASCGAAMRPAPPRVEQVAVERTQPQQPEKREHLDDPLPLAASVADYAQQASQPSPQPGPEPDPLLAYLEDA